MTNDQLERLAGAYQTSKQACLQSQTQAGKNYNDAILIGITTALYILATPGDLEYFKQTLWEKYQIEF